MQMRLSWAVSLIAAFALGYGAARVGSAPAPAFTYHNQTTPISRTNNITGEIQVVDLASGTWMPLTEFRRRADEQRRHQQALEENNARRAMDGLPPLLR